MNKKFLLERALSPDDAARVIDFLRAEGMVWHDSYVIMKVPDCKEPDLVLRKEISERLGVPLKDVMPEGAYGKILGKPDPLTKGSVDSRDLSYKTQINFDGLSGDRIIKIGFKSALVRIARFSLGHDSLDLSAEFATIRSPSFLPEVPTEYSLQVKDVFGCPKLKELDPACAGEITQYFTELVQQLRSI